MPANISQANPILVTGTVVVPSTQTIVATPVRIKAFLWSKVATAGHILTLQDAKGNLIFDLTADAPGTSGNTAYYCYFGDKGFPAEGLNVSRMDGGQLLVYLCVD